MNSSPRTSAKATSNSALHFVSPSLLRVRGFLFEQGLPILPWAPAGEVLEQFYELLRAHHADNEFWQQVSELLQALQCDLRERLESDAQDNEVLAIATRSELLDELRERLRANESRGGFLEIARRLSPQGLSVWLLLGGAATVSCGARIEDNSQRGYAGENSGGSVGTGGTTSKITATGGQPAISMPGNAPCIQWSGDAGALPDIEDVALKCTVAGAAQDDIIACVATLNQSWRDGIEWLLNCTTCDSVTQYLNTLARDCSNLPAQYNECLLNFCGTPIYNGVRLA